MQQEEEKGIHIAGRERKTREKEKRENEIRKVGSCEGRTTKGQSFSTTTQSASLFFFPRRIPFFFLSFLPFLSPVHLLQVAALFLFFSTQLIHSFSAGCEDASERRGKERKDASE